MIPQLRKIVSFFFSSYPKSQLTRLSAVTSTAHVCAHGGLTLMQKVAYLTHLDDTRVTWLCFSDCQTLSTVQRRDERGCQPTIH